MSLRLSEEQIELQATIRKLFAECSQLDQILKDTPIDSKGLLEAAKGFGLFGAFAKESDQGLGLGAQELSIVAFESGRMLVSEPLSENICFGPLLFSSLLTEQARRSILDSLKIPIESILDGSIRVSIAPPQDGFHKGSDAKSDVRMIGGSINDNLIICRSNDSEGKSLCFFPAKNPQEEVSLDLTQRYFRLSPLTAVTEIKLNTSSIFDLLLAIKASELAGIGAKVIELTAEYVKTRKQFGTPVGAFQAVQHKLSDLYLASESARSLANFACWAFAHSPEQLKLASLSAINFATENVPKIVEGAIQLHGGIGFTWEHVLHLYLRRARCVAALYGKEASNFDGILAATGI